MADTYMYSHTSGNNKNCRSIALKDYTLEINDMLEDRNNGK